MVLKRTLTSFPTLERLQEKRDLDHSLTCLDIPFQINMVTSILEVLISMGVIDSRQTW